MAAALGLLSALGAAWSYGLTTDEPIHMAWSKRLLEQRVTERKSQLHFNSKTPVSMANVAARKLAQRLTADPWKRRLASRLPTVAWYAALLATTFLLGRRLAGPAAAQWALLLVAVDPNLIGHGAIVTVDVAYALATLLTLWAALWWVGRPSLVRAAVLGAALGFAFTVKFSAFLLLVAVALAPLAARGRLRARHWGRLAGGVLLAGALAVLIVCGAYLFTEVGVRLGDLTWRSGAFKGLASAVPGLTLPVPRDFLTGVDICLASERSRPFPVVVFGGLHPDGVWYTYPVLWLFKTPVLVLAALAVGMTVAFRRRLPFRDPGLRYVAVCLAVTLAYFCLVYRMQVGYRFVLMCVPLAALLAAAGLARWRPASGVAAMVVVLAAVGERLPFVANELAFTNVAVQPKRAVFRLIGDVDFGQNDEKAEAWIRAQAARGAHVNPTHPLPGLNVVNFNVASGGALFPRHRWTRGRLLPVEHFRHTWLLFSVPPGVFEQFLEEARTVRPGTSAELCRGLEPLPAALAGARPLDFGGRDRTGAALLCLAAESRTDVIVRARAGSLLVGPADDQKAWDRLMSAGDQAWYRLEPGVHAFGARASRFEGSWEARGHGVRAAVHEAEVTASGVRVLATAPLRPPPRM